MTIKKKLVHYKIMFMILKLNIFFVSFIMNVLFINC